ncbi:hypothetical protein MJI47_29780, partial [Salmonella enterica subsp. enterica serovar Kentucky]|nr:hypothetical protein [Salmonella enterica subsp. enterica serovar Kentucky]
VGVVHAAGGLSQAVDTLHALDPKLVTPQGADDILSPAFMTSFSSGHWNVPEFFCHHDFRTDKRLFSQQKSISSTKGRSCPSMSF